MHTKKSGLHIRKTNPQTYCGMDGTLMLWGCFEFVGAKACVFVCKLNVHLYPVYWAYYAWFCLLILVVGYASGNGKHILVKTKQ